MVLAQTEKYILMATYKENMFASVCVEALEKLGILSLETKNIEKNKNIFIHSRIF